MLLQLLGVDICILIVEMEKCVCEYGFVGINFNFDFLGGYWIVLLLLDCVWYLFYEKMVELDVFVMIYVSISCNVCFYIIGVYYFNVDIIVFMQCLSLDLFKDFLMLKFLILYGGGVVLYYWGCFCGLVQEMKKLLLEEYLFNNIFFDICVYYQLGIDLFMCVILVENVLFVFEMIGVVCGIDLQIGYYYDDIKCYIEVVVLSFEECYQIYEGNVCCVYLCLDVVFNVKGLSI